MGDGGMSHEQRAVPHPSPPIPPPSLGAVQHRLGDGMIFLHLVMAGNDGHDAMVERLRAPMLQAHREPGSGEPGESARRRTTSPERR